MRLFLWAFLALALFLHPPGAAGGGEGAAVSISPASHDFGITSVGGISAEQVFRLTNGGAEAIPVSAITLSDGKNFILDLEGGPSPCGALESLAPGQSCTVAVKFAPLAERVTGARLTAGPGGGASLSGLGYLCGC